MKLGNFNNINFILPGCGHCKKAKPEYTNAAEKFKDDPKVEFAAVDCTVHQGICSAYDVKGYPSIKYFSYLNKEKFDYTGGRTVRGFFTDEKSSTFNLNFVCFRNLNLWHT